LLAMLLSRPVIAVVSPPQPSERLQDGDSDAAQEVSFFADPAPGRPFPNVEMLEKLGSNTTTVVSAVIIP